MLMKSMMPLYRIKRPTEMNETYVTALYDGTFSVGIDKKFIRIPRTGRQFRASLKISLNPFLINTPTKKILFDVGIGEFGEDTGVHSILKNLDHHDIQDFEITDIFISHLHYDHIGGLPHRENGFWKLTFPEAKIWVSKVDWTRIIHKDVFYDEEKTEFIAFLDAKANLHFLEEIDNSYPEISVETIGGHTQHHVALFFNDGSNKFLMAGDVIATRNQINRKFAAKYDYDPKMSQSQRERLANFAFQNDYLILCYHDDYHPIVRLTGYDEKQGYFTKPVNYEDNI